MRILAVLLALLSVCATAHAYRVDAVRVEQGVSVSSDTVRIDTVARPIGNSLEIYKVTISHQNGSVAPIWIGNSDVRFNQGYKLVSGNSVTIETDNLSDIYGISTVDGQYLNFITSNK